LNERFPKFKVPEKITPMEKFVFKYFSTRKEVNFLANLSWPLPQFQREIYWVLQNDHVYNKAIIVSPRGFGKSIVVDFFSPLYDIYVRSNKELAGYHYNPAILDGIMIITSSDLLRETWMMRLMTEIQTNPLLLDHFGDMCSKDATGGRWSTSNFITLNGIDVNAISIQSSSVRGPHPGRSILDDIENREQAASEVQSKYIEDLIRGDVMGQLRNKRASFVWIGTFIEQECVLAQAYNGKGWGDEFFRIKHSALDKDDKSIWEAEFPTEKLIQERHDDYRHFMAEKMNEPLTSENPIVLRDSFRFFKQENLPTNMYKILAIDPALEEKSKNDFTAMVCLGVCMAGKDRLNVYVLDADQGRWNSDAKVKRIFEMYRAYRPDDILVEKAGQQKFFEDLLRVKAKDYGYYLPIHKTDELTKPYKSKVARLTAVAHVFENGYVHFREAGQDDLMDELVKFPAGRHDDYVDAMSMALARVLQLQEQVMDEAMDMKIDESQYEPAMSMVGI
jgi:predicted phage terminase large subunit-like protein